MLLVTWEAGDACSSQDKTHVQGRGHEMKISHTQDSSESRERERATSSLAWSPGDNRTQHNRKYYATAISSPDHFLNQSAFRKLVTNQSQVLKFNQVS